MAPRALTILTLSFLVTTVAAQGTARVTVSPKEAFVNEAVTVQVRVDNFKTAATPTFPEIPGCTVRGGKRAESRRTSNLLGRRETLRSRTHTFQLVAEQPGRYTIPPIELEVDGRILRTKSQTVVVLPPDPSEEPLLRVEIVSPMKRIFVGQKVPLKLRIQVKAARHRRRSLSPQDMWSLVTRNQLGIFPHERPGLERRSIKGKNGRAEQYYIFVVETDYIADRPGPLSFDDIEVGLRYPTELVEDFFEVRVRSFRHFVVRPTIDGVDVLPVPMEGRPANFSGAVGRYKIRALATPRDVHVGDPIELTIEIFGDGPIESLPPPLLADDPDLTAHFRVPREDMAGAAEGSRKTYTQVIRPIDADVRRIPPIKYPYFDPFEEQFAIAESVPIPVEIQHSEELELAQLDAFPTPVGDDAQLLALDGLRGNVIDPARLLRTTTTVSHTQAIAALAAPPVLYLFLVAVSTLGKGGPSPGRRRARALRTAQSAIQSAASQPPNEAGATIAAAMAAYLADRTGRPSGRFIGDGAVSHLREQDASVPLAAEWETVLQRCNQASFAGGSEDPSKLVEEALRCLERTEAVRW